MQTSFIAVFLFGLAPILLISTAAAVNSTATARHTKTADIEEVIVTGRRQPETLQEAPYSVSAFNADSLTDTNIQRMDDVIALTPNVTLATSQGIGTSFISVRGLTQVRNSESPVAVIVDGVQQFSATQFRQELFDIKSVEVIKGPQGALYGRNATGGAIIIQTHAPDDHLQAQIQTGVGNGDEFSVSGNIKGPLSDGVLHGQIAANYINRNGYLNNITRNQAADRFEDTHFRGRLLWTPNNALTLDVRGSLQVHKGRGVGFQFQGVDLADDGITAIRFGTDTGPMDANNVLDIRDNNADLGQRDMRDLSLVMTYEHALGTLIATSAYNDIEDFISADQFPYTAATDGINPSEELQGLDGTQTLFKDISAFSQEVRWRSPSNQALRWEFGAYYLDWERFISSATGLDTGNGILRVEREPLNDPRNITESFIADNNNNQAWAVFGQLAYDLTDTWELSLAARYDQEKRRQAVSPLQSAAIGSPGTINDATFSKLQPKVTIRYQPNLQSNYYITWGEGFRSGQFNQNGIADAAATAGLIGVTDVVDQEDSSSFEVGYKGHYFDGKLRVGAALFDTQVENQQFFSFVGAIGAQILTSIDQVDLHGGELDLRYQPNRAWTLYTALGVTQSEIAAYRLDPSAVGNNSPYIADSTFNIGVQHNAQLDTAQLTLLTRVDFERRGEQFWDVTNSTARDALNLLNLRWGVSDIANRWTLMLSIDNATDQQYNSEWVAGGFAARAPGRIYRLNFSYSVL